jgi:enoyl-CoA hydratase/carnithine racemase
VSDVLQVRNDGHVRTIVMNRPEKKNALSEELAWGVVNAVSEAASDDSVWVICITGTADAFCSGLDLSPGADGASGNPSRLTPLDSFLDDVGWVGRFLLVLREECDKPVVGGINGVAVGAGLSLAMACDVRLMAKSARLLAGYPRIGASPDGGLTFTLSQAMGYEQAIRFLLENRTVEAEEAFRLGMVGEVVEDERFGERLAEYCQFLAERSPITARLTKRGIRRATTAIDLEALVRYELSNIRKAFSSNDAQEARKAFFEKRPPVFEGR